jgi:putative transposase
VDGLVKALGMSGVSKSQAARLCVELDDRVGAFRAAPTCVKTREAGRIVSVAVC